MWIIQHGTNNRSIISQSRILLRWIILEAQQVATLYNKY